MVFSAIEVIQAVVVFVAGLRIEIFSIAIDNLMGYGYNLVQLRIFFVFEFEGRTKIKLA